MRQLVDRHSLFRPGLGHACLAGAVRAELLNARQLLAAAVALAREGCDHRLRGRRLTLGGGSLPFCCRQLVLDLLFARACVAPAWGTLWLRVTLLCIHVPVFVH